jgi:hypothetical protein
MVTLSRLRRSTAHRRAILLYAARAAFRSASIRRASTQRK